MRDILFRGEASETGDWVKGFTVPKSKLPQCGFVANPWVWAYKFERCANPFAGTEGAK